ncbi:hypothetical protein F2Q69_00019707 [Brassica cretica]|uniref:Arabidopsis retrotransposon Orf1 C-terminal domain-containing protein n=1 Tax=Brassica cretica TaxID=69181 RepID=A0A8S9QLQ3_BRACR|nr:hypothetical protein F2Q69_00019707 [Brassica cretica]
MEFPTTNIFERFGMVGLFVERLMYYKDWVWTTADSSPQLGIGGMITPLLIANGVNLGNDPKGPALIDAPYLRIATYIGGRNQEKVVYTYFHRRNMVKLLLPNRELTNIERPGIIHFNIDESELFGPHGPIDPVTAPRRRRGGTRGHVMAGTSAATQEGSATPVYGPPRYHFTQSSTALPHGPLREAHEHIDKLQRWNKAQDRTIFKLKTKYKELKKTVKRQAEASAQFMKRRMRYLHRILVHTLYPRKEPGTVNEEELRLLYRAVRDNVTPEQLEEFEETEKMKFPTTNIFERFGMLGIGGMITPLLIANGVNLGNDPKGPALIDAPYLRIATYIGGKYQEKRPGIIHFNIDESELFGPHGLIDPVTAPKRRRGGTRGHVMAGTSAATQEGSATPVYGPPRYHFTQSSTALPHGPLREAHEHIDKLQRWNKAQDRTIFKLKTKYKELKKTVKRQAAGSAQFMKKVADLLVRGGVGRCSSEDFVTRDTSVPQPQPYDPVTNPTLDLGPPLTARQLLPSAFNWSFSTQTSRHQERAAPPEEKPTSSTIRFRKQISIPCLYR